MVSPGLSGGGTSAHSLDLGERALVPGEEDWSHIGGLGVAVNSGWDESKSHLLSGAKWKSWRGQKGGSGRGAAASFGQPPAACDLAHMHPATTIPKTQSPTTT